MFNTNKNTLILAGGALLVAWYLANKAKETVKEVATAVNPANNKNVFAEATGSYKWGQWAYCKLNPDSKVCGYKY